MKGYHYYYDRSPVGSQAKSSRMKSLRWCIVLASLLATLAGGEPVRADAEPVSRGIARAAAQPKYRRCWAVVVGINYDHLKGAARAEVPPLATAENDARAVYDLLLENYGFTPETTKLLLGPQATRENIRQLFGDGLLGDAEMVTAEDCVVIYFAGHGNRREKTAARDQFVGLLYPGDVRLVKGKGVDTVSCLRIDELLSYLRDYCAARHKLVILDSCHSGEVFNFQAQRGAAVNRGFRANLFLKPAFQAIAAARGDQTAADSDGTGQHSPVTRALLDALRHGPDTQGRGFFSASELFSYVPRRVADMKGIRQDPRGGWIAGEGDFYFFPRSLQPADFPAEEVEAWRTARTAGPAPATPSDAESDGRWKVYAGAGGALSFLIVGLLVWVRTRRPAATVEAPRPAASTEPRLMLRVVGTACLYQAPADHPVITVGRQRRKPGLTAAEGNDLVIRSRTDDESLKISRRHFEIRREPHGLSIMDRSSAGTTVNGERLVKDAAKELKPGDVIDVAGALQLEVLLQPALVGPQLSAWSLPTSPTGNGSLVLEASVGDMMTAEPE